MARKRTAFHSVTPTEVASLIETAPYQKWCACCDTVKPVTDFVDQVCLSGHLDPDLPCDGCWPNPTLPPPPPALTPIDTDPVLDLALNALARLTGLSGLAGVKERLEILLRLGGQCVCCGLLEEPFLCIDHIQDDGKAERAKYPSIYKRILKLGVPSKKYQVLCYNCNICKEKLGFCVHQSQAGSRLRHTRRQARLVEKTKVLGGRVCSCCGESNPWLIKPYEETVHCYNCHHATQARQRCPHLADTILNFGSVPYYRKRLTETIFSTTP